MTENLIEDDSEDEIVNDPFDPASISISTKVISLDAVLRRIKNNTIKLDPDFQRKLVWNDVKKSQLIESMMLRIPLPMFYVSESKDGAWEVVDGSQRLRSIRDFILGANYDGHGFMLQGLEFWGEMFNGKSYYQLSHSKDKKSINVFNNIMETELAFTIINPDTPEKVKRNIFKRINTSGMPLSSQEIKNALYQGQATQLLGYLVKLPTYQSIIEENLGVNDDRMMGRELILRFIAFYLLSPDAYKGDMDSFLSDTMMLINNELKADDYKKYDINKEEINSKLDSLKSFFESALIRNYDFFGDHVFRKSLSSDNRKTPVNKSLFEVWMFIMANMNSSVYDNLKSRKNDFFRGYENLLKDTAFSNSISKHSTNLNGVKKRYESLESLIQEVVK